MSLRHKGTVRLETDRLVLRRFVREDAQAMFNNWANDPEVTKYLTWPYHIDISMSEEVINSWISLYENPDYYMWAIVPKDIGEPIGSIGAVKVDETIKMVHIGYAIGRAYWNKGYTSEALTRLVEFFFEEIGINRIESRHDPRNPNSGKVMAKVGMKCEGTLREADKNNQEGFCDATYYGLLKKDYFSLQKLTFKAYSITEDKDFLIKAHTETFKLTFKQDIKPQWLEAELARVHNMRDGAYLGGKLIGICDLQIRYTEGNDAYGRVVFFYISPEYRNRGFGSQLVKHAKNWCIEKDLKFLTLNTAIDNFQAQKTYEKNGFVRFPKLDKDNEFGYILYIEQ